MKQTQKENLHSRLTNILSQYKKPQLGQNKKDVDDQMNFVAKKIASQMNKFRSQILLKASQNRKFESRLKIKKRTLTTHNNFVKSKTDKYKPSFSNINFGSKKNFLKESLAKLSIVDSENVEENELKSPDIIDKMLNIECTPNMSKNASKRNNKFFFEKDKFSKSLNMNLENSMEGSCSFRKAEALFKMSEKPTAKKPEPL